MTGTFNRAVTGLFDLLFAPLREHPWGAMLVVSALAAVALLLLFRVASDQPGIRRVRSRIRAYFLELWLYRDDFRITLSALRRIARSNLSYLRHALLPLLVMLPPVVAILIQLDLRYSHRPLAVGESAVLTAAIDPHLDPFGVQLLVPDGVEIEAPAVRIPSRGEVAWRLRAETPGRHSLTVELQGARAEKVMVAGGGLETVPRQRSASALEQLLHPGEASLGAPFRRLEVTYPERELLLGRWSVHWLLAFLVLSLAIGIAVKGRLRVEI